MALIVSRNIYLKNVISHVEDLMICPVMLAPSPFIVRSSNSLHSGRRCCPLSMPSLFMFFENLFHSYQNRHTVIFLLFLYCLIVWFILSLCEILPCYLGWLIYCPLMVTLISHYVVYANAMFSLSTPYIKMNINKYVMKDWVFYYFTYLYIIIY